MATYLAKSQRRWHPNYHCAGQLALTPANLFEAGGHIQTLINVYQSRVFELILFLKNKVESLSP